MMSYGLTHVSFSTRNSLIMTNGAICNLSFSASFLYFIWAALHSCTWDLYILSKSIGLIVLINAATSFDGISEIKLHFLDDHTQPRVGESDVGDNVMRVTSLRCWLFFRCVGDVINFSNQSPTQTVSNISHQHRCSLNSSDSELANISRPIWKFTNLSEFTVEIDFHS